MMHSMYHHDVRTTITLEDDVAALINEETRRSGQSFKVVINHVLRLGLMAAENKQRQSFSVEPRALGLPHGFSYENVEQLVEALEGAAHK